MLQCDAIYSHMSEIKKPENLTMGTSELQAQMGIIKRNVGVRHEHVIITHENFPIAAIIPITDYEKFTKQKKKG